MSHRLGLVLLCSLLALFIFSFVAIQPADSTVTVDASLGTGSLTISDNVDTLVISFSTFNISASNIEQTSEPIDVTFQLTTENTEKVYTETYQYKAEENLDINNHNFVFRTESLNSSVIPANESTETKVQIEVDHPDVTADITEKQFTIVRDINITSCASILESNPNASSGVYTIEPEDTSFDVYCDMETDGGGWTKVNATIAQEMVNQNGEGFTAKQDTFDSGFDGAKPYFLTQSNPGGGMEYDIDVGFKFSEMYLENVGFRSTSYKTSEDDTSEYDASAYKMEVWEYTGGGPEGHHGDIGFGVPSSDEPITTYTDGGGSFSSNDGVTDYPFNIDGSNPKMFNTTTDSVIRIAASESGGQDEGWRWERGSIYVR